MILIKVKLRHTFNDHYAIEIKSEIRILLVAVNY